MCPSRDSGRFGGRRRDLERSGLSRVVAIKARCFSSFRRIWMFESAPLNSIAIRRNRARSSPRPAALSRLGFDEPDHELRRIGSSDAVGREGVPG